MRQGPRARVRESGDRGSLLVRDVTIDLRIFTEPQQGATYDDLLRVARAAEDLGFGGFFRSDHYLSLIHI